jgi:hypothetical protein
MSEKKQDSSVTLITELSESKDVKSTKIPSDISQDSLAEAIMDLGTSLETRMEAINLFYEKFGQETILELVNRLSTMYTFSGTKILEKYIYEICTKSDISSFLKITCAKSLCYYDPKKELGYKALDSVCKNMGKDVATPCQIEAICLLMCHKKFKTKSKDYFCAITNNQEIDCDYRYKTILSVESKDIKNGTYFIKEAAMNFFENKANRTLYRILSGQYMMQKSKLLVKERKKIENTIMEFAQDPDIDYNLRADSADVILRVGSKDNQATARKIIMMLGREGGENKTIFDNAQNVHVDEIEESVIEVLEFLAPIDMKTISGVPGTPVITFGYVKKQIDDMLEKEAPEKKKNKKSPQEEEYEERVDKISVALNRIYMDRALYSKYNCTLLHVLLKVWTYLSSHESEIEMRKRMLQELYDMSGTCSTGFASRLVNVISGFGEFNLRISWRDQIVANFTGRLNARARKITDPTDREKKFKLYCKRKVTKEDDTKEDIIRQELLTEREEKEERKTDEEQLEEFQDKVLCEMSTDSSDFESRKNFLRFFRKNMLSIRQELHEEFNEHIPDTDFDLYFRQAISKYETGGYV